MYNIYIHAYIHAQIYIDIEIEIDIYAYMFFSGNTDWSMLRTVSEIHFHVYLWYAFHVSTCSPADSF